jgi:hypothetical protein
MPLVTPDPTHPSGKNTTLTPEEMASGHTVLFLTGPVGGTVSLAGGHAYDVTEDVIAVKPEHLHELAGSILKMQQATGKLLDVKPEDALVGLTPPAAPSA